MIASETIAFSKIILPYKQHASWWLSSHHSQQSVGALEKAVMKSSLPVIIPTYSYQAVHSVHNSSFQGCIRCSHNSKVIGWSTWGKKFEKLSNWTYSNCQGFVLLSVSDYFVTLTLPEPSLLPSSLMATFAPQSSPCFSFMACIKLWLFFHLCWVISL